MAARAARQFSVSAPAELADEIREHSVSPSQAFQRGAQQLVAEKATLASAGEGARKIEFDVYDRDGEHVEEVVLHGKLIAKDIESAGLDVHAGSAWSVVLSKGGRIVVINHTLGDWTETTGYAVYDDTEEVLASDLPDDVARAIDSLVTSGHVRRVLDV